MSTALVTDTHPLLNYFCNDARKLSKRVRQAFQNSTVDGSQIIYVPTVVLWEISILLEKGAIKLNQPFEIWVAELFAGPSLIEQGLDRETVFKYHNLRFTKDPFDKAIVATALRLDLPLITNDSRIHSAVPCKLFWD